MSLCINSSVPLLSRVWLFVTTWTAALQASLSFPWDTDCPESVMPPNCLILCLPFFCFQSLPASGSSPVSWLFSLGGQSIGASASASVLPVIFRVDFPLDWLVWSPCSPRASQESSPGAKASILWCSAFFIVLLSHLYMTTGKSTALGKVIPLLFNMLSMFVVTFLPRSKRLLISWLQSPSAVILEPKKIKSVTVSIVSPSIFQEVMGPDAMILVFWMLSFKSAFYSPLSLSSRGSLIPLHFLP